MMNRLKVPHLGDRISRELRDCSAIKGRPDPRSVPLMDMTTKQAITCQVRYRLDMSKLSEFEAYARAWIILIERHGGTHHGYFMPRAAPEGSRISFPNVGHEGPTDIALALFTFPDEQAYLRYRQMVADDPDCGSAEALYRETECFHSYERLFLTQMDSKL